LRSLTRLPKHGQARRPAVTLQIHLITQRQNGHKLANSPLTGQRKALITAGKRVLGRDCVPKLG
jgi:hypothetical protein